MITPLSEALAERGYETLTAVQQAVTEPDVGEEDLLVSAQTGSGKTVGFGLAIASTLLPEDDQFGAAGAPLALVVAPTRELAFQVMQELRWLYAKTGARICSCVGGMDMRQERRALEHGAHIVVGTPGRLSDHIRRGSLELGEIRAVVLDEADEMLDLGFREDLEFILGEAPEERRTLLFSATVSPMIAKLAEQFQKNARRINTINKAEQHSDITYKALHVAQSDSDNAIFNLLRYHDDESAIVFANTRAAVNHLAARLGNRGLSVVTLSGELSQSERSHALQAMRDGRARICVATDVAARGIDLPNLSLVIHADLPTNTESLLHRSGRTGRAGRKGISALIVPSKATKRAERLLKWAKINAEWEAPPSAEAIRAHDEEKLMADPAWAEPADEELAAFAARLLERFGPEAVATAFLRERQSRHAAPEELMAVDGPREPREPREHREFGPSRWFSIAVGRNQRAEPRWLLPMLLRATDLEKTAIGAIRIQPDETYIEIAEAEVQQFLDAIGPDMKLPDDVAVEERDGPPARPERVARPHSAKPGAPRAGSNRPMRDDDDRPKPRGKYAKPERAERPAPDPRPNPVEDGSVEPYAKRKTSFRKPEGEYKAPYKKGPKSDGKSYDKPKGGKSFGSKPGAKPGGKPGAKPAGKSFGAKPARKGGDAVPRRGK